MERDVREVRIGVKWEERERDVVKWARRRGYDVLIYSQQGLIARSHLLSQLSRYIFLQYHNMIRERDTVQEERKHTIP